MYQYSDVDKRRVMKKVIASHDEEASRDGANRRVLTIKLKLFTLG